MLESLKVKFKVDMLTAGEESYRVTDNGKFVTLSKKDYCPKITIFYKVWSKVFEVEEFESELGFSKFWV